VLLKTTEQELHELVAVENALLGQVVDEGPVFWGLRHSPVEHRVRVGIPGIKIKLTHHNHPLSGPGDPTPIIPARRGFEKEVVKV
jgi:hypothetical protein